MSTDAKREELLAGVQGVPEMDTGQDDVSRIIGKVKANVAGRDWIIGPVSFECWASIQEILLEGKRKRMLMTTRALRGIIPDAEYRIAWREALSQVGNTSTLGAEDADYLLATPEGMGTVLWVLIEDSYGADPTRPSLATCKKEALEDKTMKRDDQRSLGRQLFACMGIDTGEETGKNENGPPDQDQAESKSQD